MLGNVPFLLKSNVYMFCCIWKKKVDTCSIRPNTAYGANENGKYTYLCTI